MAAVLLNVTMTIPYEKIKEACVITFGDNFVNPILALVPASLSALAFALPFDSLKTRIQN